MHIDIRTAAILRNRAGQILLLKRSHLKKLLPNLITGIGGKVELEQGEGNDIDASILRELQEEVPQINPATISEFRLRVTTQQSRGDHLVFLFWYTGIVEEDVTDLRCSEGELLWCDPNKLPLERMTPSARSVIPFIVTLAPDDTKIYDEIYQPDTNHLITT